MNFQTKDSRLKLQNGFDVEVDKNQVEIKGQGPYQYISKKF